MPTVQTTAPAGFRSNYHALLYLLRFGFEVWDPPEMAVLLFHAERATLYGREADQHSATQAEHGIYGKRAGEWIRGRCGVSRASWHRINTALEYDPDQPDTDLPTHVLRRMRRTDQNAGDAPTQYQPDWPRIRAAIQTALDTKALPKTAENPLFAQGGVSQPETRGSLSLTQGGVSAGHTGESQPETHSKDSTVSDLTVSAPGAALRAAVADALGTDPGARLTDRLLQIAGRLDCPEPILCRWVQDFAAGKHAAGYPIVPGLLATAAATDLIPWLRQNRRLLEVHARQLAQAAAAAAAPADVAQLPTPEAADTAEWCPHCERRTLYAGACSNCKHARQARA